VTERLGQAPAPDMIVRSRPSVAAATDRQPRIVGADPGVPPIEFGHRRGPLNTDEKASQVVPPSEGIPVPASIRPNYLGDLRRTPVTAHPRVRYCQDATPPARNPDKPMTDSERTSHFEGEIVTPSLKRPIRGRREIAVRCSG